jgi:hypothetical protein
MEKTGNEQEMRKRMSRKEWTRDYNIKSISTGKSAGRQYKTVSLKLPI